MIPSAGCALLMDMGTGKTLTAIAIAGRLYLDGNIKRLLVVAPASVCTSWPGELSRFAGYDYRLGLLLGPRDKRLKALRQLTQPSPPGVTPPLMVAVVNYESTWRLIDELKDYAPDMIICDESQRIKAPYASQSKAMHTLGGIAKYRLILTGTPVQNNTLDIWSQYQFLAPGTFSGSFAAYRRRYAIMGGVGEHQYFGPNNLDELRQKAHAIAYRVTKDECLDLPEKTFTPRLIPLEPAAQKLYDHLKREAYVELSGGAEVTAQLVVTKLLRLQQLTGGFITDDDGNITPVSSAKLDALMDIVQTLCIDQGGKVVIFARFVPEIEAICEKLASMFAPENLSHVAVSGAVSAVRRGELVSSFQNEPNVRAFVGQIEACAEGLTLTAASTVVYYSTTWNYAKYRQSQDRIHRISQKNACLYIDLIAPGTVDEKIYAALSRKEDLATSITDNWRELLGG